MKRLVSSLSFALLALGACRAVLGIEDLAVDTSGVGDGASDAEADTERDAAPAIDASDGATQAETSVDAGVDAPDACGTRALAACIACCSAANQSQSNAVFAAEQPCACNASLGGCAPVCSVYCASPAPDTEACTDCAARNLVDGGACLGSRAQGPDFVRCLDTCPFD